MTTRQIVKNFGKLAYFSIWDTKSDSCEFAGDFDEYMEGYHGLENEEVIRWYQKANTIVMEI